MRRVVLSPLGVKLFILLHCGGRFEIDDFARTEGGLGGKPALVEVGVAEGRIFILVELSVEISKDLPGISKEDRLGRLGR